MFYIQEIASGGDVREHVLEPRDEFILGRGGSTGPRTAGQVTLKDPHVSRRHTRLFRDESGQWLLEDLGSRNGTRLDGELILEITPVTPESAIQLGTSRITFSTEPRFPDNQVMPKKTAKSGRKGRPAPPEAPEAETVFMAGAALPGAASEGATVLNPSLGPAGGDDVDAEAPTILGQSIDRPGAIDEEAATVLGGPPVAASESDQPELTFHGKPGEPGGARYPGQPENMDEIMTAWRAQGGEGPVGADQPAPHEEATVLSTHLDSPAADGGPVKPGVAPAQAAAQADTIHSDTDNDHPDRLADYEDGEDDGTFPPPQPGGSGNQLSALQEASMIALDQALDACTVHGAPGDAGGGTDGAGCLSQAAAMARDCIDANLITPPQMRNLMAQAQATGRTFFSRLARDRSVKFLDEIYRLAAKRSRLNYIPDEESLSSMAQPTSWLPFSQCSQRGAVALEADEDGLIGVGFVDPFDMPLRDWIDRCTKGKYKPVLVHPDAFFPTTRRLKDTETGEKSQDLGVAIDISHEEEALIRENVSDVDVPQIVNYFLHRSHVQKSSDIHIEPTEDLLVVRNRVDGILRQEISLPMPFHAEVVSRIKILSRMDVAEKRRPQDGRFSVTIRNNPIDVRVSSFPTVFGEKFVLRLLDKNALRPSIESVGFMERDLVLLKDKIAAPFGMVMISGPTGSGKTTTLYSCLGGLDREKKNILTVEDPVEYRLTGVHQMQVNSKIGLTFSSGLRTILRQDPDVIMVGEIRDNETAQMAVQAALTGHIVFSTIHTNSAVGVVTRLLDMGIEPFLVASSLSLAIAQRLVRKICTHCRFTISGARLREKLNQEGTSNQRLEELGVILDDDLEYFQGAGCNRCRESGYLGRQAVFEMFEMTDEGRNLIMSGEINATKLRKVARKIGMTSLIEHGMNLVEEEVTSVQEVIRVLGEEG